MGSPSIFGKKSSASLTFAKGQAGRHRGKPRAMGKANAAPRKKQMAHDLGLLLKPVVAERAVIVGRVGVAAEGMAHQRQIEAPMTLRLLDMGHFVNEQPLQREGRGGEVVAVAGVLRMEVYIAGRRHDDAPGLE